MLWPMSDSIPYFLMACWAGLAVATDSSAQDDDVTTSSAETNIAVIIGLSGGLFVLLWGLLKHVEREDLRVQQELDSLRRKRLEKGCGFRLANGYSWDYVMVFEIRTEDEVLNDYQRKFSMKEILNRLAMGGFETRMYYSVQRDEVYCKIRCPMERLEREAGRVDYKLMLEPTALRNTCQHGRAGKWAPIDITDEHGQCCYEPYEFIYAPYVYDRSDVEHLYKKYGDGSTRSQFRGVDRLKIMYGIMVAKKGDGGSNLDIVRLVKGKCLLGFFPLHDKVELRKLQLKWLRYLRLPWKEPVDDVKDYFGEKIGLYFLWLSHYTTWLASASICGLLAWVHVAIDDNNPSAIGAVAFAVFIALWSTCFTEFWKRKQHTYAMRWGMTGFEEAEQTRPQFKGVRTLSPVDGKPVDYFPPSEATKRLLMSQTVIMGLILMVIGTVASIFVMKYFMTHEPLSTKLTVNGVALGAILPSLANSVQIQIMNMIYGAVAIYLNDLENHRTDTSYEDNLIAKTFMFQFVNSYASLFYIAFIKNHTGDMCVTSCMSELSTNLGTIFLTRLAVGNLTQVLVPIITARQKRKAEMKGVDPDRVFSEAEKEYCQETYDVMLGTFNDYAEKIIQFGYATLFVAAYPLSCLMAFVSNYIKIRVDAWKLLKVCRRPEPRSAEDIGTWYTILEIMSAISVIVNSALVAFTSDIFMDKSWAMRVWIFIFFEHGMILFKCILALIIPDTPRDVEIQRERCEFLVSKVIRNAEDDDDEDLVKDISTFSDHTIRQEDDDE